MVNTEMLYSLKIPHKPFIVADLNISQNANLERFDLMYLNVADSFPGGGGVWNHAVYNTKCYNLSLSLLFSCLNLRMFLCLSVRMHGLRQTHWQLTLNKLNIPYLNLSAISFFSCLADSSSETSNLSERLPNLTLSFILNLEKTLNKIFLEANKTTDLSPVAKNRNCVPVIITRSGNG